MERSLYPAAIHLFFRKDNNILLLRRFKTGYEDGNYSVVAGHVEFGETVTQAGIREAKEEVGVTIHPEDLRINGIMHRKSGDERIDFFAFVDKWKGDITNMEAHKCDELLWSPIDSLPGNIIPYVKRAMELPEEPLWYEEFGW